MDALAILLCEPRSLRLERVELTAPGRDDVVVGVEHTGISTGTERLLWDGTMPSFPGMGYPLVPGYETVGRVVDASSASSVGVGDAVFVPGARCYVGARPLFGGAAARLVVPAERLHRIDDAGPEATLFALAATAHHAVAVAGTPDLVIGHGALGRLVARIAAATGPAPTVHEVRASRADAPYAVFHPDADPRRDYRAVIDASGDHGAIDLAVARLAKGGIVTLAGFYGERMSFAFPAAFMREARILLAAEFTPADVTAVRRLLDSGRLSLDGIVTHQAAAADAPAAYAQAFTDPDCTKMVLNWRDAA